MTTATGSRGSAPGTLTPAKWRRIRFEALDRIESLPSLSNVVLEFLSLARREYFSAKDFETVICKDQALVARLLKVANCGLYGRSRSITSIPEAVVLIGLENLKKIVYAVSSAGLMRKRLTHYEFHAQQGFWIHSVALGQSTKAVAEASPHCPLHGEEGLVAGLLHDVGKLIIDEFLVSEPGDCVSGDEEREAVGLDHAELAEHILKQWNLPESITGTVRHHHDWQAGGQWRLGAAALSLAHGICGAWGVGRMHPVDLSQDVPVDQFSGIMAELGLQEARWPQLIWDIRQNLVSLEGIFNED